MSEVTLKDKKEVLVMASKEEMEAKICKALMEANFSLVFDIANIHNYYDQDELISVGTQGLVKAANSYDTTRNTLFRNYASKCISNEINNFLKKASIRNENVSLETPVQTSYGSKRLKDIIIDDDPFREIFDEDVHASIRSAVALLPSPEREIVQMRFGFIDNKIFSLRDIASKLHLSYGYVSELLNNGVELAAIILSKKGIIDLNKDEYTLVHDKKGKVRAIKKDKLSIYKYFSDYSEDEINYALSTLTQSERGLLPSACGEAIPNEMSEFIYISRKLKKRLDAFKENKGVGADRLTTDDYKEIVDILNGDNMPKRIQALEESEKIVALLSLGYVNGKYFSSEFVSDTLGIPQERVLEIIDKTEEFARQERKKAMEKYLMGTQKSKQKTLN